MSEGPTVEQKDLSPITLDTKTSRRGLFKGFGKAAVAVVAAPFLSRFGRTATAEAQEINPNNPVPFTEEEKTNLQSNWDNVSQFTKKKYGIDINQLGITVTRKVPIEGATDRANRARASLKGSEISVQSLREEDDERDFWELNHEIGHIALNTINWKPADTADPIEKEFYVRWGEGMAEAFAYETHPLIYKNRQYSEATIIDNLRQPKHAGRRQRPDFANDPFTHDSEQYWSAAAALLNLQDQFGEEFFPEVVRYFNERAKHTGRIEGSNLNRKDVDVNKWGYQGMLNHFEEKFPGFKEALRDEPILHYLEIPA